MNRFILNVFLSRFFALVALTLGLCLAGTLPAAAATGNSTPACTGVDCSSSSSSSDQIVNGYLTLVGPRGEQVAIYCVGDVLQYGASPNGMEPSIVTSAVSLQCDSVTVFSLYPGYRLVMNPSPMTGWVFDRWSGNVSICQNGMLLTLNAPPANMKPDYKLETSRNCGYIPSRGA